MQKLLVCCLMLIPLFFASCKDKSAEQIAAAMTGGNPSKGRIAIDRYGCASCHVIPGINGPKGQVGPPLAQISERVYIGGVLTNTPENMIQWLENPRKIDPKTAMPNVGLKEQEARDIASYLYTLQ